MVKTFGPLGPLNHRWAYARDLLYTLVGRELKLRYRRSLLGFAWSLLNPLAQLLVFGFVFRFILPLDIPNYTVFLFSGLLPWNWFSGALYGAAEAMTGSRELVRRPGFPPAVLPVVTVTSHLVHFALALPVLFVFLWAGGVRLTWAVLALPAILLLQFVLTLSLGYLLAAVHVTFRDTQYLLNIALMLGFYLTPVFYDPGAIPGRFHLIFQLNPMSHLIGAYRAVLLEGRLPDLAALALVGVISAALLLAGYRYFTRASDRFVEEL